MKLRYAAMSACAAVVLAFGSAIGAGWFPNFPIVGDPSYCASFVTGTNIAGTTNQICGQTVPAGPSGLTGYEFTLADLSPTTGGGSSPQTVAVPLGLFVGGTPFVLASMANGGTITMSPQHGGLEMTGNGNVTTATTVVLPAGMYDRQRFSLGATVSFANLTVSAPTGYSLTNVPNGITPSVVAPYGFSWILDRASNTWYRLQ